MKHCLQDSFVGPSRQRLPGDDDDYLGDGDGGDDVTDTDRDNQLLVHACAVSEFDDDDDDDGSSHLAWHKATNESDEDGSDFDKHKFD